jgi:8-oxo-dGTP pyrophosphatase MutT (NUDIX family)
LNLIVLDFATPHSESNMQHYVLGLLKNDHTWFFIRKNRPHWQAGKLNGIGGKVEPGENADQAMVRETLEETSVDITRNSRFKIGDFVGVDFHVHCFLIELEEVQKPVTNTDEMIVPVPNSELHRLETEALQSLVTVVKNALDPQQPYMVLYYDRTQPTFE